MRFDLYLGYEFQQLDDQDQQAIQNFLKNVDQDKNGYYVIDQTQLAILVSCHGLTVNAVEWLLDQFAEEAKNQGFTNGQESLSYC